MATQLKNILFLKKLIWLYFWLLIFEGALRKWVLPGLTDPLLVARDPVAIYILYQAGRIHLKWINGYVRVAAVTTVLSLIATMMFGHQNLVVALYGARIMLLHFPLIFIIGLAFDRSDVLKMGRMFMILSIPMTVLLALQFLSPQSAWVNRGMGGLEGGGFTAVMGYFRPPGTFSFTTGVASFYTLCAVFAAYFWLSKEKCPLILKIASSIAIVLALPLSISRLLVASVVIVVGFCIVTFFNSPKIIYRIILLLFVIGAAFMLLQRDTTFQTASEVSSERFRMANEAGGGLKGAIVDRFFGNLLNPIIDIWNKPIIGSRLGMGTNVGAALLLGDEAGFLLGEGEWERVLEEGGILFGLVILALRCILMISIAISAWHCVHRGNLLPWLILSMASIAVVTSQWAQPSILGFSVLATGLLLASFKAEGE